LIKKKRDLPGADVQEAAKRLLKNRREGGNNQNRTPAPEDEIFQTKGKPEP